MDPRAVAAEYYDLNPHFPEDEPFYLARLPAGAPTVLELGCGTGRLSVPLARRSVFLHGIDNSPAMANICRRKLLASGLGAARAGVSVANIADLHLNAQFDYVVAPFRVLQNLESDAAVAGLFASIRAHLRMQGRCILNAFRPYRDAAGMRAEWSTGAESLDWEVAVDGGRVACFSRRTRMDAERLVLYPDLIYRRYQGERLVAETTLSLAMRCWYPDDLLSRVAAEGFAITGAWGGYAGEPYGKGPELVVEFRPNA